MSAGVCVGDRVVGTVCIQVQAFRVGVLPGVGVFRQEAAVFRVVITGIQVVEPCSFIVDPTGEADLIVKGLIPVDAGLTEVCVL